MSKEIILNFEPTHFEVLTWGDVTSFRYQAIATVSFARETTTALGYIASHLIITTVAGTVFPYKFKFPAGADYEAFKIKVRNLMFQMIPKKEYEEHISITIEGV